MTALLPFSNGEFEARVILIDDDAWFVAADVARTLGYSSTAAMTRSLDEDEKGLRTLHTPGGEQEMTIVSEAGLFTAILRSRVPAAKAFRRWVTHTVLPALLRDGSYAIAQVEPVKIAVPTTFAEALQLAADQAKALERQKVEIAELEPRAAVADALLVASGDISVREAAQVLTRDHGIEVGQNRLFAYLREMRWLDAKGMPYQQHVEAGRVALFTGTYDHPISGEPMVYTQARVTPRGLAQLHGALTAGRALAVVR